VGKAHFVTAYEDKGDVMLASSHRADGIILDALIATEPKNDLIPKLARGLLDARTRGRWETTQENVFALLALERYFRTYENVTPDFVARLWLGEKFAGEQAFRGRTADSRQLAVPLGEIPVGGAPLTLQKDGAGRLYYRVAMTYAPLNPDPNPFAAGFEVDRIYEAVDDPADVRRDSDGTWHFRAGARIRVKVSFSTNSVKQHVALADPLPAGLEALNPELAGTQAAPPGADRESGGKYWWWGPWYSHRNLRDDRAEAFAEWVPAGSYTFAYYARATTPGVFRVAPAKAEEMYHPETFGRTGAGRVVIE
jgi:alpha-2-macroglobulin